MRRRRTFSLFALAWMLGALPARAEELAGAEAITGLEGNRGPAGIVSRMGSGVWVRSAGEPERRLRLQENVRAGQILRTSRGSGLEIRFYKDGVLSLVERTRVTLADPGRAGVVSNVVLAQGVIFLAHDPSLGPEEVEVRTQTASVRLRGTRILVAAEPGPEGATSVTVLDGAAEVTSLDNQKFVAVGKGFRTRVEKRRGPERPWKADPSLIRLALELWKPGTPLLEGGLTDAILLLVAR